MAEKSSFFVHFSCLLLLLTIIITCGEGVRNPVRPRSSERRALMDGQDLSRPLKLTFGGPSRNWTDAIPIGNGRLGATIWGGVSSEILNINEDTIWTGVPADYTNQKAPEALAEVRRLVDERNYAEATSEAVKLSGQPSDVYQIVGDLNLEFDSSHRKYTQASYRRELDLETAVAKVSYSVGAVDFSREFFASNPDQVIIAKIYASKPGSLSFKVSFDSELHHHSETNPKANQILMRGSCRPKRLPVNLKKSINATNIPYDDHKGLQFASILEVRVSNGGSVSSLGGKKLSVEKADWAVLLLAASSNFDGPFTMPVDSKIDPAKECVNRISSVQKYSYSDLYARHLGDYQKLFNRVSLHLSGSSTNETVQQATSTAERVRSFKTDQDPSLVELLFQYGRYLLISSSRPGTQVANLQGIWNRDIQPPWDGAPHLNINLQMNYWHSLPGNIRECQEPLFDYMSALAINGRKTAQVNYGASGWVAHQVSDIWAKTSPDRGEAVWALWPMGGAWLCTHAWEHYTYTMDKEFLKKKGYPLLEGCTSFLLDWLIKGKDGFLQTNPSTSPEHMFTAPIGKPASVSYSSTMDIAIIKEVFADIVSASEILGKTNDTLIGKVIAAQAKLPPTRISKDGSIREWAEDFEDPEVHHRHVSHLFGLFPGHTITVEKSPELAKAVEATLKKRGEEGPGWSTTWKAALWARLHNSEHAYRMVTHIFDLVDPLNERNYEGGLYSNMFTAHPPFQIDANFGFAAAVAEMLVQSTTKDLYLLPALPADKWPNGIVNGLRARGGVTVSIKWMEGNLVEFGLWSEQIVSTRIVYRGISAAAELLPGKVFTFDKDLRCIRTDKL
ncbi:1,2-alpha-L-fucosidase [Arabidopsis thaliana]|jgi:alpha-L-fucosidase 2|uniref:Alpha-L-fucosidase 2 n=1 Tax=Arabidopsis thaliana TaxID=3702 RepID=FUCO2_ARATH|nr:1,2-alpha-L-fucosidase [Arabidopsis thaliana]Q8L7W8.1 RecName: Full=Alpha-L-fucosidase 2; AltName: Full=Alpha-1,2-fucosidase 2; AltName: Full=Alpha-L-fucosidase 95A; Short=AtFuc95A; AltName: Full=Alpha-L-fucoside fucohydrolase 2; AltName: Full=Protein ALTERED XYLOGLUCAN 8; Flags: Precursor [Arabidopsis thaliana]AAM78086.1 AT4g34260/F10M10_30 [Arabidopsis thaliana]AAO11638.1 At4g34260/F10M10_30 [Arabidopsis thaliana]AEE86349.1 1,2-alpha-L-fucosidase [Arabidopsis thaliana]|eukprot:NP_195152.2 1,2-alpha-L-fucosidase [Arabidopsis thaliana]